MVLLLSIVATLGSQAVFHSIIAVHPEAVERINPDHVEGHTCTDNNFI
jgi:hypothetical protein